MMTVLAVDDSQSIRQMVAAILVSNGYEVEQAEDGQAGLELATDNSYDVIISDVNMPKMDGLTLLKTLGEGAPPVVIVTASATIQMTSGF